MLIEKYEENREFINFITKELLKNDAFKKVSESFNKLLFIYLQTELKLNNSQAVAALLNEVETKGNMSSVIFYGKLVLLVNSGKKLSMETEMTALCSRMEACDDFSVVFYLKLINELVSQNPVDEIKLNCILTKFFFLFEACVSSGNLEVLNFGTGWSLCDIVAEALRFLHSTVDVKTSIIKINGFLEVFTRFIETFPMNCSLVCTSFDPLIEILNILLTMRQVKNSSAQLKMCSLPVITQSARIINCFFFNFTRFYEALKEKTDDMLIDIMHLYKFVNLHRFAKQMENQMTESESDVFVQQFEKYEETWASTVTWLDSAGALVSIGAQVKSLIQIAINFELMIKLKSYCKANYSSDILETLTSKIVSENCFNKRIITLAATTLFQEGKRTVLRNFLSAVLEKLWENKSLMLKSFTIKEFLDIYQDFIEVNDIEGKLKHLIDFLEVIENLKSNLEVQLFLRNAEWVLMTVANLLTAEGV